MLFPNKVITNLVVQTVKSAHVVSTNNRSPIFKGHPLLSCHRKLHMNPF